MLHLRLVVPSERTAAIVALLRDDPAVTNVILLTGAGQDPPGDVVLCDVPREQASVLLATLREHGVEQHGGIGLEPVETLGRRARRAERIAKGSPADAVVWEEVRLRIS